MLHLLRRIRKSLVAPGAGQKPLSTFGRHLLYATGEIILVMAGILLALQVNNWNEKKSYSVERQMLTGIRNSLVSDLENEISDAIKSKERSLKSLSTLIDNIEHNYIYHDSLMQYFGVITVADNFEPQISTYRSDFEDLL